MIVVERGSPLAHLAIIAREQNKGVVLVEDIIEKIPGKGEMSIVYEKENVQIEIR